ncbi:hypothetical protein IW262DRAFT_1403006, partial [Armillaria fumosa]
YYLNSTVVFLYFVTIQQSATPLLQSPIRRPDPVIHSPHFPIPCFVDRRCKRFVRDSRRGRGRGDDDVGRLDEAHAELVKATWCWGNSPCLYQVGEPIQAENHTMPYPASNQCA